MLNLTNYNYVKFLQVSVICFLIFNSSLFAQNNSDGDICPGASIKSALRSYIGYVVSVNDENLSDEDGGGDMSDPDEDALNDDESDNDTNDSTEEEDLVDLGEKLESLTKLKFYFAKSPEALVNAPSKNNLKDFRQFDSINWDQVSEYNSDNIPVNMDAIFENNNCRTINSILSSITASRLKKVSKANLKTLDNSLTLILDLSESMNSVGLVEEDELADIEQKTSSIKNQIKKLSSGKGKK